MTTPAYLLEVVALYNKLVSIEQSYIDSLVTPATPVSFFKDTIEGFDMPNVKAELLFSLSSGPSFAEAFLSDAMFKMLATKRDLAIRSKSRLDFFADSSMEASNEIGRLQSSLVNTQQYVLGNTAVQTGKDYIST